MDKNNDKKPLMPFKGELYEPGELSSYYLLFLLENQEIDEEQRKYLESNKDKFLKDVGLKSNK